MFRSDEPGGGVGRQFVAVRHVRDADRRWSCRAFGRHRVRHGPADRPDRGARSEKVDPGPQGTPLASLFDQTVLTVSGSGLDVKVPLRCLFALSGMGFLGPSDEDEVRVTATLPYWFTLVVDGQWHRTRHIAAELFHHQ